MGGRRNKYDDKQKSLEAPTFQSTSLNRSCAFFIQSISRETNSRFL